MATFVAEVVSGVVVALAVSFAAALMSCGSNGIRRLAGCKTADQGHDRMRDGETQQGLLDDQSSPPSGPQPARTATAAREAAITTGYGSWTRGFLPRIRRPRGQVAPLAVAIGIRPEIPRGPSRGRLLERGGSSSSLGQGRESLVNPREEPLFPDAKRREGHGASQRSFEMVHSRLVLEHSPPAVEPLSPI